MTRLLVLLPLSLAGCAFMPPAIGGSAQCDQDVEQARGNAAGTVSSGGVEYMVGSIEVGSGDRDPFVARIDDDSISWCRVYSREPTDERGEHIALSGDGSLWVAFRTTNSGTELVATDGAFQWDTGPGDGKDIIFLASLDPDTGVVRAGTFVRATLSNGNTNAMELDGLQMTEDDLPVLTAATWYTPPPFEREQCTLSTPFMWRGTFSTDVTRLTEVSADGCIGGL